MPPKKKVKSTKKIDPETTILVIDGDDRTWISTSRDDMVASAKKNIKNRTPFPVTLVVEKQYHSWDKLVKQEVRSVIGNKDKLFRGMSQGEFEKQARKLYREADLREEELKAYIEFVSEGIKVFQHSFNYIESGAIRLFKMLDKNSDFYVEYVKRILYNQNTYVFNNFDYSYFDVIVDDDRFSVKDKCQMVCMIIYNNNLSKLPRYQKSLDDYSQVNYLFPVIISSVLGSYHKKLTREMFNYLPHNIEHLFMYIYLIFWNTLLDEDPTEENRKEYEKIIYRNMRNKEYELIDGKAVPKIPLTGDYLVLFETISKAYKEHGESLYKEQVYEMTDTPLYLTIHEFVKINYSNLI